MLDKDVIEDVTQDCPCRNEQRCFAKYLLKSIGLTNRLAEEARLIFDYQDIVSKREGRAIGEQRAKEEFIELYAAKFAEVYKEGIKHDKLFERLFGIRFQVAEEVFN